jgi:hypothetical protein
MSPENRRGQFKPFLESSDAEARAGLFGIRDIYTATWLAYSGYRLVKTNSDGFNSEFFFAGVPADALLAYTNGKEMSISPRKMFDVFQALRRTSRQYRRTDVSQEPNGQHNHEEDAGQHQHEDAVAG